MIKHLFKKRKSKSCINMK